MRALAKLRELLSAHTAILQNLDQLERGYQRQVVHIKIVFDGIRKLLEAPSQTRTPYRLHPTCFRTQQVTV
jgi:hypothetical protein